MAPKREGTERPDRQVETLAPTERLVRGRGAARVRMPVCACSVAREGGSEGCARCAARATARSPRGKKKPHAVKTEGLAAHPRGKEEPGTERHKQPTRSAGGLPPPDVGMEVSATRKS
jgi:hypothetical protein